ncbi:MAG: hypothetical protein AB7S26_03320 [Sandaracinaceae bacterium]
MARSSRPARTLLPLVALAIAGAAGIVRSQDAVTIATGFAPDPVHLSGTGGGDRSLRELGAGCDGFVGDAPSKRVALSTDFGFLRVFAVSAAPIVLAVRDERGQWRCTGRRIGVAMMEEGRFPQGHLEIWVGSPERGTPVGFDVSLTEFRSVGPAIAAASVEPSVTLDHEATEGRFRGRRLRRGFLPDPREDDGQASGTVDVRSLGPECRGFVESQPSHILTLRSEFDYFRVQLGDAAGQATLVMRTPGGRYLCSAPEERNAFLDQDAWPEGEYPIWVGVRAATEGVPAPVPYHICYTEVRPAEGTVHCGHDRMGSGRAARPSGGDEDD